jgi:hypothetical protein
MLIQFLESIAESFRHRFDWPSRQGAKVDEYQERHDETRGKAGGRHDARAAEGHYWGHPDSGPASGKSRRG